MKERPDLIPIVAGWYHEEWGHLRSRSFSDMVKGLEDRCVGDYPFTLIALRDDEPVGTASLKIHDMDILQEFTPSLSSVFVPPSHRGKQIASSLVAEVEMRAKNLSFTQTYLYTSSAVPLYQKLGYESMQALQYNGLDVVVMQKAFQKNPAD